MGRGVETIEIYRFLPVNYNNKMKGTNVEEAEGTKCPITLSVTSGDWHADHRVPLQRRRTHLCRG